MIAYFIGGHADGRQQEIPNHAHEWFVHHQERIPLTSWARPVSIEDVAAETTRYTRRKWRFSASRNGGTRDFQPFAPEELSDAEVMELLLKAHLELHANHPDRRGV